MELKFSNDTNFIKFWPPQVEILRATRHYTIHPGHYIPNIPDISVHPNKFRDIYIPGLVPFWKSSKNAQVNKVPTIYTLW